MKRVIHCIAWCLTLCLSQQLFSQTKGIPFTASYTAEIDKTHVLEKDQLGNVIKAKSYVSGTGTHSILGDVTVMSILHYDLSKGDNIIEFTETDADGNSLFIKTKGVPAENGGWKCYSAILGGTGKYKKATGNYIATGTSNETSSKWTAEGTLFYTSEETEKTAIKKVIAAETQAYIDKDFDAMDNAYAIAPYTTNITNVPIGTVEIAHRYKNGQPPVRDQKTIDSIIPLTDVVRSDWDIQIRENVAWAIFNQKLNAMGSRYPSVETRILEKINGQWKLVYSSTFADHKGAIPLSASTNK